MFLEAVLPKSSLRKVFCKISSNIQKNTCHNILFEEGCRLRPANFLRILRKLSKQVFYRKPTGRLLLCTQMCSWKFPLFWGEVIPFNLRKGFFSDKAYLLLFGNIIKIKQNENNKGAVSLGPLGPYFQSRGVEEPLSLQPEDINLVG